MINEANLGLQAETIDIDVASSQGTVHTLSLKDPHPIQRGLADHIQEIGNHPTGGDNPHFPPQT